MKYQRQFLFLAISLIFSGFALGQMPHTIIDIEGRLIEQTEKETKGLSNVEIWVMNEKYETDEEGNFAFKVPFSDDDMKMDIRPLGYKILKPLGGILNLNPNITILRLEIYVISESADSKLKEKAAALEKRLVQSQQKNALSRQQLNRINQTLIDTMAFFEKQKYDYNQQISQLNSKIENTTTENHELKNQLLQYEQQLAQLNQQVDDLTDQLFVALEDKFLRQQAYFKNITADLNNFLVRAKDAHQMLPQIKSYYPMNYSREGEQLYKETISAYNDAFAKLNENQEDYLKAVEHYWESNQDEASELKATLDILFNDFHYGQLQPSFADVENQLRRNKKRKAAKVGASAAKEVAPVIDRLEKSVQQSLTLLEINL